MWDLSKKNAGEGDLIQLVGLRHKHIIFTLEKDKELHTHRGIVLHNDLIGLPYGTKITSHNGAPFFLLQPSLADILLDLKRSTQILYPKDIGYILVRLGIGPGIKVVEAGTGSGGMTTALAYSVGDQGKVISYDQREDFQNLAKKNLNKFGLIHRVDFKLRDIALGMDESDMDAFFLDVPYPHDYISQVRDVLKPGGFFCSLVPTTNQVSRLISALRIQKFGFIEVAEIMLRFYKPEPERLRPTDRMVAHTGFLVFARPMIAEVDFDNEESEHESKSEID